MDVNIRKKKIKELKVIAIREKNWKGWLEKILFLPKRFIELFCIYNQDGITT